MKSSITTLEDNKVKLSVEVDEIEIDGHIDEAFKKIAKDIRLPGFRPGKAPRKVLEARLGKEFARGEAIRDALPEYYRQAIIEHDIDVIAPPDLDITRGEQEDGPVQFEAVVEVRPQITVAGYQGLRVEIPAPVASQEDIDTQLDQLRNQFAERVEVDRPAQTGDFVTMDIGATHDGEDVDGLGADDYTYEVGAGFVVEELDEYLVGAKVGDILEFDADHPDPDEDGQLNFRVLVKKTEEKQLPDLDDDFADEATEFDTAEALVADTRQRIETELRAQSKALIAERTAVALAELVDLDVPQALIDDQVQQQLQDMSMRLAQQGMQLEQFLEATGQTVTDLADNLKEPAERAARVDLALRSIVIAENMQLTDDELQEEINTSAAQLGQTGAELREAFEQGGQLRALRTDLLKHRAMDMLIEEVEVVDEDGNAIDRASLEDPVPAESDGIGEDEGEDDTLTDSNQDIETDETGNTGEADDVGDIDQDSDAADHSAAEGGDN